MLCHRSRCRQSRNQGGVALAGNACPIRAPIVPAIDGDARERHGGAVSDGDLVVSREGSRQPIAVLGHIIAVELAQIHQVILHGVGVGVGFIAVGGIIGFSGCAAGDGEAGSGQQVGDVRLRFVRIAVVCGIVVIDIVSIIGARESTNAFRCLRVLVYETNGASGSGASGRILSERFGEKGKVGRPVQGAVPCMTAFV